MGVDPAPFFTNLFLYHFESESIKKKWKTDPEAVRFFYYIFRFIDDLISINDNSQFEKFITEIYPSELDLKKENFDMGEASFLDILIKIEDRKFKTSLYDNRDSFNFDIVRMPYKKNNIPKSMFCNTISSEVLRIASATSHFDDFVGSAKTLLKRMAKQKTRC